MPSHTGMYISGCVVVVGFVCFNLSEICNKFVWNLLVQLKLGLSFFFFPPKSTTTCNRNRSDSAWENPSCAVVCPLSCLVTLTLDFFTTCSLDLGFCGCVCAAQYPGTPLPSSLAAVTLCQFVKSGHSEPEKLPSFLFGVAAMLNVLSLCSFSGDILRQQVWFDCFQPSVRPLNFTKLKLPVQSLLSMCHFND